MAQTYFKCNKTWRKISIFEILPRKDTPWRKVAPLCMIPSTLVLHEPEKKRVTSKTTIDFIFLRGVFHVQEQQILHVSSGVGALRRHWLRRLAGSPKWRISE
jgi:hypothetical protein